MKKRIKFLIVYGIIVLTGLLLILFIIPDSCIKKHSNFKKFYETKEEKKEFLSYEKQIEKIRNEKYNYDYQIEYNGKEYNCKGIKDKESDIGSCTKPEKIEYTSNTYKEVYKDLNINFLDVNIIFDSLKDIKYTEESSKTKRIINYKIKDKKTEITIYTDLENINKIIISKEYATYILKYTNISV